MYEPPALLLLLIMQGKRDGKSSTKISDVSFRPVMAQTRRRSNEIERLSLQFDERCVERKELRCQVGAVIYGLKRHVAV